MGFLPSEGWCWQACPQCLAVRMCLEALHSISLWTQGQPCPARVCVRGQETRFPKLCPAASPPWCLHTEPPSQGGCPHCPPIWSSREGVTGGRIPLWAHTDGASEEIPELWSSEPLGQATSFSCLNSHNTKLFQGPARWRPQVPRPSPAGSCSLGAGPRTRAQAQVTVPEAFPLGRAPSCSLHALG